MIHQPDCPLFGRGAKPGRKKAQPKKQTEEKISQKEREAVASLVKVQEKEKDQEEEEENIEDERRRIENSQCPQT